MSRPDFTYSAFARSPRLDRAVRTTVIASIAVVIGAVVGGLSVLGVVVAVTKPPDHGSRADVAKGETTAPTAPLFSATPRQVQGTAPPTSTPNPSAVVPGSNAVVPGSNTAAVATAAAPPPATPQPTPAPAAAPVQAQVAPPAQGPQTAWPDALSARTAHSADTGSPKPAPSVEDTSAPESAQIGVKAKDSASAGGERSAPDQDNETAASQTSAPTRAPASAERAKKRPAVNARSAPPIDTRGADTRDTHGGDTRAAANEATGDNARPLYNSYRDERGRDAELPASRNPAPAATNQRYARQQRPAQVVDQNGRLLPPPPPPPRVLVPGQDSDVGYEHHDWGGGFFGLFGNDGGHDDWH